MSYYRGTVNPIGGFDPNKDAAALHDAKKMFGINEGTVVDILTTRNNDQRQQIKRSFKTKYGEDLVDYFKSHLKGQFETLAVALVADRLYYDVSELNHALKNLGTHEDVLIEILASRSKEQIRCIVAAYQQEYHHSLEEDIKRDCSGHFERMLVILLQANRLSGVDESKVISDAKALENAGEKKFGTDEDTFITILGNQSHEHLRRVFDQYKKNTGFEIEDSICKETSGNLKKLLLAVVKCTRSVPAYFTDVLHKSMKGLGTDDHTLIRVMVSRSEVDMLDIRENFKRIHKKSLYDMIKSETSGPYSNALLALCGNEAK